MTQFYNNDQSDISAEVNAFTLESSIFPLTGIPLDAKSCNFYQLNDSIVIETIPEYLERVFVGLRVIGQPVTILKPKDGYVSAGTYLISQFELAMGNYDVKSYAFIGGLSDENFVEFLTPGRSYHHVQSNPSRVWEITHNLNKYPTVIITDNDNNEYEGEVKKIDENNIVITFSTAFSGYADLN